MAVEITDANFDEVVMNSDKPVLVDFGLSGADLVEWLDQSLKKCTTNMKVKQ